jgi:hypothetical protein
VQATDKQNEKLIGSRQKERTMRRIFLLVCAVALAATLCSGVSAQSTPKDSIERVGDHASINWTSLMYVAEGEGAVPTKDVEPNRAKALLKAKDYAKMAAIANLLMAIEGTAISYESVGKDYMAETTIRQKIEGFVKNVEIAETRREKVEGDEVVTVKVKAPMFGKNAPGTVFMTEAPPPTVTSGGGEIPGTVGGGTGGETPTETSGGGTGGEGASDVNVKIVLKPDVTAALPTTTIISEPSPESTPYTGLIIDASGYKITRAINPKIRRNDGSEVWGTVEASAAALQEKGIVAYATSMTKAKANARAGSNPLIIRAIGRAGKRFYPDVVLSDSDAALLMSENGKSGFLDSFNVVFVKDPRS